MQHFLNRWHSELKQSRACVWAFGEYRDPGSEDQTQELWSKTESRHMWLVHTSESRHEGETTLEGSGPVSEQCHNESNGQENGAGWVWNRRAEGLPFLLFHRTGRNSHGVTGFTLITLLVFLLPLPTQSGFLCTSSFCHTHCTCTAYQRPLTKVSAWMLLEIFLTGLQKIIIIKALVIILQF